ncbi:MAG: SUMF1/EgtB/PvdO family nonheme iron enzyme [Pseudomonadota bacterium]
MLLSILALAALLTGPAIAQDWDRQLWDPQPPVEGQIELPIPCDGYMVFVPVETPVTPDNPLSDRELILGGADPTTAYSDYFRTAFLRGGFTDGAGRAFFYMAKYEVTRDQWDAVTSFGAECPNQNMGGARPQAGVSWFGAVEFTRALTEWVRQNHPGAMPSEDGAPGFARLPTGTEWEYAARGGVAVGDDQRFRAALPPMPEGVGEYAWFQGRRSSNGSFRPVGMKLPNPLGLDGMFGGVEEIVFDPYALNNLGRLHGQPGGFVTRGGSIGTPEGELSSALQVEWPYFDATTGAANAADTIGLRPVLAVHVNTSTSRTGKIRDWWQQGVEGDAGQEEDPLAVLDELIKRRSDQRLLDELEFVRGSIVSDRRARDADAGRALKLSLLNGAVLSEWMRRAAADVARQSVVRDILAESIGTDLEVPGDRETVAQQDVKIAQSQAEFELAAGIYVDTLTGIADVAGAQDIAAQTAVLEIELTARGQQDMVLAVTRFAENVGFLQAEPGRARQDLLDDALR